MPRPLILALLLAAAAPVAAQQTVFVAPTDRTVIGSMEQSAGSDEAHVFYVTNRSSVPIIVFGFVLTNCENVKQWCSGRSVNIPIAPDGRRMVGRAEPKFRDQSFGYRWSFSWKADSSDAKAMAALRENGVTLGETPIGRVIAGRVRPEAVVIDTTSPPGIEQPLSREPLTPEERGLGASRPTDTAPDAPVSFRFKVHYGSILGSTMMPGAPVQLLGPCIDPAESAKYERDAHITRTPWRPPVLGASLASTALPAALRDSVVRPGDVLVRWVADTSGATIPGSVRVLESPHPLMSVNVCTAVIGARATPARDQAGRAIRAWVQMPVKVERPMRRPDLR